MAKRKTGAGRQLLVHSVGILFFKGTRAKRGQTAGDRHAFGIWSRYHLHKRANRRRPDRGACLWQRSVRVVGRPNDRAPRNEKRPASIASPALRLGASYALRSGLGFLVRADHPKRGPIY